MIEIPEFPIDIAADVTVQEAIVFVGVCIVFAAFVVAFVRAVFNK